MRIEGPIRNCVAYVGLETPHGFSPYGSGFLGFHRGKPGEVFSFLITAHHVVNDIPGERVSIRLNLKAGGTSYLRLLKSSMVQHRDKQNDVAVFPLVADFSRYDVGLVSLEREDHEKSLTFYAPHLGDEVYALGMYTSHYGLTKNIPVARIGNIAMMPDEPVHTDRGYIPAYLMELRTLVGLSGSPVFLSVPQLIVVGDQIKIRKGNPYLTIGVLLGYHMVESAADIIPAPQFQKAKIEDQTATALSVDERNTGFGIVVPIERILEIMDGTEVKTKMAHALAMASIEKAKQTKFKPASAISPDDQSQNPEHRADAQADRARSNKAPASRE